jgi:hypothetical protein
MQQIAAQVLTATPVAQCSLLQPHYHELGSVFLLLLPLES